MISSPKTGAGLLSVIFTASHRALALAIALSAALAVSQFPILKPVLGAALLLYAAALYRFPYLWLLVLPAVLPVIDLALWSGRFFFDEFDFLIMTTLAVLYWRRAKRRILPKFLVWPYLPMTLLALSYGAGVAISLTPLPPVDLNSFSTYMSPYNALRVAKGFFWAWLLMPFLIRELANDPNLTKQRLITGITTGLGLAGICVLWERGVFVDLFWGRNIYALLGGLLDFTGTYRITGMFSGMNVGDTAIDAYLALAVPISLYPVVYGKSPWIRLTGLAVFTLGGYGLIVTFSRGLYAAFGLALVIILSAQILEARQKLMQHAGQNLVLLAAFALATYLMFHLYASGGYEALIIAVASVTLGALAAARLKTANAGILLSLWLGGSAAVAFLIHRAISHHKWSTTAPEVALGLSLAAALLLFALPAVAARKRARHVSLPTAFITALLVGIFWMGTIPSLSGIRVMTRFATSHEDMATRQNHWRNSFAAMLDDWPHRIWGMGVGSFPRYFLSSQIGKLPLASYQFYRNPSESYMTLGAGDFNMIQRLRLKPDTAYKLKLEMRSAAEVGVITARLCHKHILYSERWVPDCQTVSFRAKTQGRWLTQYMNLNSGTLGRYGIFYWPTTFMLQNGGGKTIEVTNISLTGPDGQNLIKNGDFAAGGDNWFLISDFEHMAWHAKNLFIHLYFEQGIIGLAIFLIIAGRALNRLRINHLGGDRSAIFWAAGICAFLTVGLFGTSLDVPRVTLLFYLVLFASLVPAADIARRRKI